MPNTCPLGMQGTPIPYRNSQPVKILPNRTLEQKQYWVAGKHDFRLLTTSGNNSVLVSSAWSWKMQTLAFVTANSSGVNDLYLWQPQSSPANQVETPANQVETPANQVETPANQIETNVGSNGFTWVETPSQDFILYSHMTSAGWDVVTKTVRSNILSNILLGPPQQIFSNPPGFLNGDPNFTVATVAYNQVVAILMTSPSAGTRLAYASLNTNSLSSKGFNTFSSLGMTSPVSMKRTSFSPNGKWLVAVNPTNQLFVWEANLSNGNYQIQSIPQQWGTNVGYAFNFPVIWSNNGDAFGVGRNISSSAVVYDIFELGFNSIGQILVLPLGHLCL
jgi:hypothetical protein